MCKQKYSHSVYLNIKVTTRYRVFKFAPKMQLRKSTESDNAYQGLVVQSIVSLTSSSRGHLIKSFMTL